MTDFSDGCVAYCCSADGWLGTNRTVAVGGDLFFWRMKRLVDVGGALLLLPLLGGFAFLLLIANPWLNRGSLFFQQERMGRRCEPFTMIKFRSMRTTTTETRAADGALETDRITPLGTVLRKTRIDELPQILNVLRGEMSLIGPRPDHFSHASDYLGQIPEYRARHAVRPGIGGLAQVTIGYAQGMAATRAKAAADIAYIENAGFALDLKIVWLTLVTVILRRGA